MDNICVPIQLPIRSIANLHSLEIVFSCDKEYEEQANTILGNHLQLNHPAQFVEFKREKMVMENEPEDADRQKFNAKTNGKATYGCNSFVISSNLIG